mgnify:CR=1 FL=1
MKNEPYFHFLWFYHLLGFLILLPVTSMWNFLEIAILRFWLLLSFRVKRRNHFLFYLWVDYYLFLIILYLKDPYGMTKIKSDVIEFYGRKSLCSSSLLDGFVIASMTKQSRILDRHVSFRCTSLLLRWRESCFEVSCYYPYSSSIKFDFRNIFSCESLIARSSHLVFLWEIDPELRYMLYSSCFWEVFCHEFVMQETTSSSHPLDFISSYNPTMTCCISVFYLSRVDNCHCLKASMRMKSNSWAMSVLWRNLPRSVVIQHKEWTGVIRHLTTISRNVLWYTKTVTNHMMTTRMLDFYYIFLHTPMICEFDFKSTLFYKV